MACAHMRRKEGRACYTIVQREWVGREKAKLNWLWRAERSGQGQIKWTVESGEESKKVAPGLESKKSILIQIYSEIIRIVMLCGRLFLTWGQNIPEMSAKKQSAKSGYLETELCEAPVDLSVVGVRLHMASEWWKVKTHRAWQSWIWRSAFGCYAAWWYLRGKHWESCRKRQALVYSGTQSLKCLAVEWIWKAQPFSHVVVPDSSWQ